MARLFFLLSGEHETLPIAELKAILEAEGYKYRVLEKLDQLLRVETDLKSFKAVKNRAAFTKLCGLELFTCEAEPSRAIKALHSISLDDVLKKGESFAVRIKHVKTHASEVDGMALERKLGADIFKSVKGARVNLKNPEKTFTGILTDNKLVFGLKIADVPPKSFTERRPKKKPFFHPSAMPPKFARCMVNLAKPRAGDLVFDPFCGTGSILIEAALMGCRVIGLDIQRRMARGSLKNFRYFGIAPEGLIVADAKNPPVRKVDCVVADPPYGKSATTLKRATRQIIEECLKAVYEMLGKGQHICMAAPKTVGISQIGTSLGYKCVESHLVYIHRSLTREIAVFKKI
ncbi:MAG: TRM11 family methyltransferase [Candidatus Bathyarchaeota archaeon]|nr:N-6 DNA methylase [Candidatus Bathyarchaeota archaeon A05DMB-3]MDH7606744.1 TRM11 family methyltransferase [Candidatus Bathyarchaeota archaeon]